MNVFNSFDLCRKWWKTWGTLPVLPWLRAAQHYKAGRFEKAVTLYKAGLDRKRNHPAKLCARLDLAFCLFKLGKLSEAEQHLKLAVTQHPDSRDAQLRLAQFQMWIGHPLDAAWTIQRALKVISVDAELAALLVTASIEGGAPNYLLAEASRHLKFALNLPGISERARRKAAVAQARLTIERGDFEKGREKLYRLTCEGSTSLEAIIAYSELLIEEGKIPFARQQLRRGLLVAPNHPRVLSLLAESYLRPGQFQNPDYALQLATSACQFSDWKSPRELHVLAESYYTFGDKMAALLMASKAKQVGSSVMSSYRKNKSLNQLIAQLSTGTHG
jgi:predicted Zn-dependent protease